MDAFHLLFSEHLAIMVEKSFPNSATKHKLTAEVVDLNKVLDKEELIIETVGELIVYSGSNGCHAGQLRLR